MENKDEAQQWGFITKMVDRLQDEANRLNWGGLTNEVAKVFEEATKETDRAKIFFDFYQYFFRLYNRVIHFTEPGPFNVIHREIRQVKHEDADFYVIHNYDYNIFKWAQQNSFTEMLDNGNIRVPASALSPAQIQNFEKRIDSQR